MFDCFENVRNLQIGNTELIKFAATIENKNYIFFIKKLKKFFFAKMKMLQRTNFLQASDMTIETKPVSFDLIVKNVSIAILFRLIWSLKM